MRRATQAQSLEVAAHGISIHTLLAESDDGIITSRQLPATFLSTLSLRRATRSNQSVIRQPNNFYPHSPCGERRIKPIFGQINANFYPHSPCGERPRQVKQTCRAKLYFYPHSPCGERRYLDTRKSCNVRDFYPHSPCGERPYTMTTTICTVSFLSTLSLRRATSRPRRGPDLRGISIHTLLAESDIISQHGEPNSGNFYPHSPCGERQRKSHRRIRPERFLSTLSLRRATIINPHSTPDNGNFYPHSPCGERQHPKYPTEYRWQFLSTLSLRRATVRITRESASIKHFYPHSPCGERRWNSTERPLESHFYPHSPCGERLRTCQYFF